MSFMAIFLPIILIWAIIGGINDSNRNKKR